MKLHSLQAASAALLTLVCFAPAHARGLTFEERVHAQEALERVRYSHQIGAKAPFEEAVPRDVLERKVATYLEQTVALEKYWHTPLTAEMLEREMTRQSRGSRMPDRLRELYAALGNDSFLIQECLARPALVDRLARSFLAFDGNVQAERRREAEELRGQLLARRIDPHADHPNRSVLDLVRVDASGPGRSVADAEPSGRGRTTRRLTLSSTELERRRAQLPATDEIGSLVEDREAFSVRVMLASTDSEIRVATFAVTKRGWQEWWSEVEGDLDGASIEPIASEAVTMDEPDHEPGGACHPEETGSCLPDDTWDNGSLDTMVTARTSHTVVWTGREMIVWGGVGFYQELNTGLRYDPATDTWASTSTAGAPAARYGHTAIWTGREMILWGGYLGYYQGGYSNTGGRYDPASDTWEPTSTLDAPEARDEHTAIWTGRQMIVWGGHFTDSDLSTGGLYDPETNAWTPTSQAEAPQGRTGHTAVWTGTRMVVWGGRFHDSVNHYLNTGGRYDPATDSWTETSMAGAPEGRTGHTSVWTGTQMVVWGGYSAEGGSRYLGNGGCYDPADDTWTPTSVVGAPEGRYVHTAVWTGGHMIVWGGSSSFYGLSTGGRYDPVTDTWASTSLIGAPDARLLHTAVWTGSLMLVWGGGGAFGWALDTGGRYEPTSDTWTPTSIGPGPTGRGGHTAVWTGNLMILWGGYCSNDESSNTGSVYDAALDTSTPTSTVKAPPKRANHTAVWTGSVMVVWGGAESYHVPLATGGRYDPLTDTWRPTSSSHAASPRTRHTAIWTGDRMIVWGGEDALHFLRSGGTYDPVSNVWTRTSPDHAPKARSRHTAVWTGSEMVVWGGFNYRDLHTGGRYDPVSDTWRPTSDEGAPSRRYFHTAVWTGHLMIVWGGQFSVTSESFRDSGGRYDPLTDTWTKTSRVNVPLNRANHTAVWTGGLMVIWGGDDDAPLGTGGRYDPVKDTWAPTSSVGAPSERSEHTAIWTGTEMIVWGGYHDLRRGGRYAVSFDADGDGYRNCDGDCDDSDLAVHPGALEVCDGKDNDCDGVIDEECGAGVRD
jgi:N-acetylneuraminic acid mutarotase